MEQKLCIAAWHYPHRTIAENIRFFKENGFDLISLHGGHLVKAISDPALYEEIGRAAVETSAPLTIHYALPEADEPQSAADFENGIRLIARWSRDFGMTRILSFDVPSSIRPNIIPTINFVLDTVPDIPIAVEDFGLNECELAQIEILKEDPRFSLLADLGHLHIRLGAKNTSGKTIFSYSQAEDVAGPVTEARERYFKALAAKPLPIAEVHVHNNNGVDDDHDFLERGTLDMKMIAGILKALNFQGVTTIESAPGYHFSCYGEDADKGILATKKYWESL